MPLSIVHMKSRKTIFVIHPWTATEWYEWLEDRVEGTGGATILLCDEKGTQYVVPSNVIEFVAVPLQEGESNATEQAGATEDQAAH